MASSATSVAILTPFPEPKPTSTITRTEPQVVSLIAGQWNYLFYHPGLKKVVLVNGGPDHGKPKNDPLELWAWDGMQWALLSADPEGPVWRNFAGAAFDSKRNRLVLYAGLQSRNNRMEETWEWDGLSWHEIEKPGVHNMAQMIFDPLHENVLLMGGGEEGFPGDMESWDGTRWSQISERDAPARTGLGTAYGSQRNRLVAFGGVAKPGGGAITDTWEWDGQHWSCVYGCK